MPQQRNRDQNRDSRGAKPGPRRGSLTLSTALDATVTIRSMLASAEQHLIDSMWHSQTMPALSLGELGEAMSLLANVDHPDTFGVERLLGGSAWLDVFEMGTLYGEGHPTCALLSMTVVVSFNTSYSPLAPRWRPVSPRRPRGRCSGC